MRTVFFVPIAVAVLIGGICRAHAQVAIRSTPKQVLIEKTKNGQELNFDFLLENKSDAKWELTRVTASVLDAGGNVIVKRFAQSGLEMTLPGGFVVEAKKTKLLFNPFFSFNSAIELKKIKYEFFFTEAVEDNARSFTAEVTVSPLLYRPRTALVLPVGGRTIINEGHDFYAHHRRVDLTNPVVAKLGVTTNPTRFGYDFVPVNKKGEQYRAGGKTNQDWYGLGVSILAPAGGIVKEIRNTVDDNILGQKMFDFRLVFEDIKAFYGNYIIIDHQNGEYSLLLHLRKGSVSVKVGDRVRQGQPIAAMGISGDADFVHLHYQLQNATEINNESLPAYFTNFRWWHGKTFTLIKNGSMETGDIVESATGK